MLVNFDANGPASPDSGIFGLPCSIDNSELVILPVPWDATTSYLQGTAGCREQILEASRQIDLWDEEFPDNPWQKGICLLETSAEIAQHNHQTRQLIEAYRLHAHASTLQQINQACAQLNDYVFTESQQLLATHKVILLGGEHSISLGYYQALAEKHAQFGILHLDAHLDMRQAYEGFSYSHASIMYNSLRLIPQIQQITSVGIRDYCVEEANFARENSDRIRVFSERELQYARFRGTNWHDLATEIIADLPPKIIISWDIDGLDPGLCPHTGTPVMGGRSIYECYYLLHLLRQKNIQIIGVDLVEIGGNAEWDANVAGRILYKLAQYLLSP